MYCGCGWDEDQAGQADGQVADEVQTEDGRNQYGVKCSWSMFSKKIKHLSWWVFVDVHRDVV